MTPYLFDYVLKDIHRVGSRVETNDLILPDWLVAADDAVKQRKRDDDHAVSRKRDAVDRGFPLFMAVGKLLVYMIQPVIQLLPQPV